MKTSEAVEKEKSEDLLQTPEFMQLLNLLGIAITTEEKISRCADIMSFIRKNFVPKNTFGALEKEVETLKAENEWRVIATDGLPTDDGLYEVTVCGEHLKNTSTVFFFDMSA